MNKEFTFEEMLKALTADEQSYIKGWLDCCFLKNSNILGRTIIDIPQGAYPAAAVKNNADNFR